MKCDNYVELSEAKVIKRVQTMRDAIYMVKELEEAEEMYLSSLESVVRRLAYDVEMLLDAFRDEDAYATYMILEDMEECARAVTEHIRATSPVVEKSE